MVVEKKTRPNFKKIFLQFPWKHNFKLIRNVKKYKDLWTNFNVVITGFDCNNTHTQKIVDENTKIRLKYFLIRSISNQYKKKKINKCFSKFEHINDDYVCIVHVGAGARHNNSY